MSTILENGTATVTLTAGQSIAVYTLGSAQVLQRVGYPNQPSSLSAVGTVTGGQTVFGPYASGGTFVINAGAFPVTYVAGTAPMVPDQVLSRPQPTPIAVNTTGAVSAAAMLGGIVTSTTAAAVAGTVPTGTVLDAASAFAVNDSFDWSVINTGGANAFTVTAATDHTLVGAAAVAANTSGHFRTRKTAANTFVTYRLA
jgi:hypothetical protein